VSGRGAEGEVGDNEGVVMKDSEGGKEGVWDVKGGGGDEDFEGRRGGGDKSDGVEFMKTVITVFWLYSKPWVGPRGKGGVGRK